MIVRALCPGERGCLSRRSCWGDSPGSAGAQYSEDQTAGITAGTHIGARERLIMDPTNSATSYRTKAPPAFQFYPGDWLGSPTVMTMTPAQRGAYIQLLAICWNDRECSLPSDDSILATLSGLGPDWATSGMAVKGTFSEHPKRGGFLTHLKLLDQLSKLEEFKAKCAQAGRKGKGHHKKRSRKVPNRYLKGTSKVPHTLQSSSSSSSSSTSSASTSSSGTSPPPTPQGGLNGSHQSMTLTPDDHSLLKQLLEREPKPIEEQAWNSAMVLVGKEERERAITFCVEQRWLSIATFNGVVGLIAQKRDPYTMKPEEVKRLIFGGASNGPARKHAGR